MKVISYRTTMPFDNATQYGDKVLSPLTQKSIMPANNVLTIQDLLNGNKKISDFYPHGGGDWSPGKNSQSPSYKPEGDDYKRRERDLEIIRNMLGNSDHPMEKWKVKVPGGSKIFMSFSLAQQYESKLKDRGVPFVYLSRIAQKKSLEKDRVEVISDSLSKCFMVESIDVKGGMKETGSAFCVAPNLFITCAHVIKKYNKNEIESINVDDFSSDIFVNLVQNGSWNKAELVDINLRWDIALLKCDIDAQPFELDQNIGLGDDIISISSPHGYENNVSTGVVGSLNRKIYFYRGSPEYMFVDLSIFPGSSGGPIIKESNGKVVGMITLIVSSEGDYGLNAGLSSRYIEEFYKSKVKQNKE